MYTDILLELLLSQVVCDSMVSKKDEILSQLVHITLSLHRFMEIKSNECVSDLNLWDDEVIISVQLRNKLDRHNRAYWPHDSYKTEFDLLIRNNSAINYNRNLIWLNDWLTDCCLSEHELYYTDKCM